MKKLLAFPLFFLGVPVMVWAAEPLDVTAEKLDINQADNNAVFSGNVKATRGSLTVTAAQAVVTYGSSKNSDVDEVIATGNVVITRAGADQATGDRAVYTPATGKLVLTGSAVMLTRGAHTVQGTRLDYDTVAGQAQMQGSGGAGGRVRAHFQSGGK